MRKITPAREARRSVGLSRRRRQLADAVVETLEKRQLLTTYVVDKTVDLNDGNFGVGELTLREAVFLANNNAGVDTINVNVAIAGPQFLLFGGALQITESVNINGTNLNGAGGLSTVNGQANSAVFDVGFGSTVNLSNMTIRNGRAANGGGVLNAGNLTLSNVIVTANSATVAGGGIYNTGTVTLNSSSIVSSNNASTTGGGIYNSAGTVILSSATLQANTTNASGIGGNVYSDGGSVSLTNSTMTTGSATDGAGIYSTNTSTLTLTNSTVSNNNAVRFGGGIFNTGSSSVTLNGSTISGNSSGAAGSGGGIYSLSGTVTIGTSTLTNNRTTGPNGGAIRNAGTLNITNSTISNNISNSSGGGIYNTGVNGIVTILGSTLSGNQSVTSDGGAILSTGNAVVRVINSTISGNSAAHEGGGIHIFSGTGVLTNSTITNNRADSDNNATGIGGGIDMGVLNPNVTMNNTIVASNYVGAGVVADDIQKSSGTLTGSNNLIGTGGSGGLVNAVNGNQVGVDNPFLGPLANNGGSTLTHALLPISPAINKGNTALAIHPVTLAALTTDQRGGPRVIGTSVDIGAFEVTLPLTLVVDKTVDLNDGNFGVGELTLREAVFLSNSYPQTYNIVFNVPIANPQFLLFSGSLSILDSVNIDGTNLNAAGGQAIINGQNNSTVFDVAGAATVNLADMTVRQGRASNGGGIVNAGNLTLSNVLVTANSATVAGGGIYNSGTLILNGGSIVSSNNASTTGGGIYNNAGSVSISSSTLQANSVNASGIGGNIYNTGGSVSLSGATLTTGSATDGAGIYNTSSSTLSLTNSTISNQNAVRFGGGIFNTSSSSVTLNNTTISGNSSGAAGSGGGIYSLSGTITINNSTITNNRTVGPNGGGIRNAGTLNITNSTISNNISNSSGGGVYNTGVNGKVTILSSTLSGNQSVTSDGGAIFSTGNAIVRVLNSTISGNSAAHEGGGVFIFSGTGTITNVTITNNRADSDNNSTGNGGGLFLGVLNPNVTMSNTIVADNYVGAGVVEDDIVKTSGTLTGNNNLIGTGGSGGLVNGVNGNLVGVANPMLGALANNGGSTLTHLPQLGSPAIHAGDSNLAVDPDTLLPFTSDQRGGPRYLGVAVDIGSVEAVVPLTLIVDNTVDLNNGNFAPGNLTLREAIDLTNANPGLDAILFNVGLANPQFLLFGGPMFITDSVNIDGTNLNGAGGRATVNGNATSVVFNVGSGTTVGMTNMTIRNGRASAGGGMANLGNLTLNNVTVTANSATVTGGGIHNTGTLTINTGSIISSNNASTTGGGIYNSGGTVIMSGSTMQANTTNASGIGGNIYNTSGSIGITGSTVTTGSATDGAGIYNTSSSSLSLTNSTLSNNNAVRFGGGIFNTSSSSVTLNNVTVSGNSSGVAGSGGGIYSLSGTISISNSTFNLNRTLGPNGGAIRNAGTMSITNSTISNNISNAAGGGIYNTNINGNVTILNSTISGNQSITGDGGGIENTGGGTLRILNSTISGNTAANRGGGIHAFSGTLTITNATITNNHADNDNGFGGIGGGLHLDVLNPNVTMSNTIVADNYVGSGVGVEDDIQKVGGTLAGYSNLIGTGGSGGLVNAVNGNQVGVANPLIGPLANNGGPTLTHTLLLGSPAIHTGDSNQAVDPDTLLPFASDQRGLPRYLGVAVDIGSVEVNVPLTLIVDNTVDLNNGNFAPGNLTLREAVDLANANPGLDTILFNVGLANPQFLLFSGTMSLTDAVTIDGTNLNGAGGQAVVHGNNNTQPFSIAVGTTVNMADMTIRNGRATNGAGLINAGTLTLTNVQVTANTATLNGGGIYNTGTLTLNGGTSVSTGNASTTGAGIYNTGTLIMNTATIQGNAVSALGIGGGIYNSGGIVNLTSATITANTGSDGAGIYNVASGTVTLTNSTVSNNNAVRFGGGIYNSGSSTVTLNNSLITGNSSGASGSGGGIYSISGTITATGSTISNNRTFGPNGGAVRNAGTLSLTNSTVSGNISNAAGGGIYNTSTNGILTILNSTISGNQSITGDGGGIESTGNATLKVVNSTISGNTAANRGGGMHLFSGTVTITNTTITNNHADNDNGFGGIGGGLHLDVLNPNVTMNNTIVADNYVGSGVGVEDDIQKLAGTLNGNNNLIGTGGSGGLVDAVNGNQVGVANPRLGALANNGGPTLTHALLPGSTAIQGGSNALALDPSASPLTADQRGNGRVANGTVDIGAVEFTIQLNGSAATNEGATYSLTVGPIIDNAATNTSYRINWGDGSQDVLTAAQLALASNIVTHVYADENPTATPSDPYTITLDVQDAFTSPGYHNNAASKGITVNNLAPTAIISGAPVNGVSGSPINMTGSFTDPGTDTIVDWTWNVTKNGVNVATQSGLSTSFTYTPTSPGHYIVSLVATDDDTGVSAPATATIHVSGAQIQTDPTDITKTALFVYGTAGNDTILLTKVGISFVRVTINSVIIGTFAPTGRVIVQGGTGNDTITDSTVVQHTILYGGEGNDTVTSNGANDILVGGNGNDVLVSGNGDDVLIAGDGADSLDGGVDKDLLIGGSTSYDVATLTNMASLYNILNAWSTSGAAAAQALLLGNVTDDAFADTLTGGTQNDLFYADSVLDITDAIAGDTTVAI